jgi:hypothetical protein
MREGVKVAAGSWGSGDYEHAFCYWKEGEFAQEFAVF